MKRHLKLTSLLMVFLLVISFAGCGSTGTETGAAKPSDSGKADGALTAGTNNTAEAGKKEKTKITLDGVETGTLPIVDKPITLTYWVPFRAQCAKTMESFSEMEMYKKMAQMTGITLKFIHPALEHEAENYKLLIASQELPDIVELTYFKNDDMYPGGLDKSIQDGIYLRLNELIEKNAPNYKKIMKQLNVEKDIKTDNGNIVAFQMMEKVVQPAYGGPAVRRDWLDELGIDTPVTINDWYEMLKAFRDKKGAKSPLLLYKKGVAKYFAFGGAYGVLYDSGAEFFRVGNTVHYGPIEPGFKDYMATLHKWYEEKLIDRDFLSIDDVAKPNTVKKITSGEAGAISTGFYAFDTYEKAAKDTKFKIEAVPYPVLKKGDTCTMRQYNEHVRGDPAFITTACKYPEAAVKLLDFNYSDQGYMLNNYGVEGHSYKMVNNEAKYTDIVTNNPDFPGQLALDIVTRQEGPFVRNYTREYFSYKENALKALDIWKGDNSGMMPKAISLTADEGARFNVAMSDIKTYVSEMVPKFIMGAEPLDKYDKFVAQIKQMGIEEMVKIMQSSLDRYNSR